MNYKSQTVAGVAVTYPSEDPPDLPETIAATRRTAERITARIGGQVPAGPHV